jgi:hypothetical protein
MKLGFAIAAAWLAISGAGRALGAPPVVPRAPRPAAPAAAPATSAAKCASCHVESSWSPAKFDHQRTGFPLREAHSRLACVSCHPQDFKTRIADTCSGCHRDRHRGELGLHCEGCHDEKSWKTSLFGPDTHRRTSFPLSGKHAVIPCRECHGDLRDMTFSRAPVACIGCHRGDYDAAAVRSIDHAAAGFDVNCQTCHNTWKFSPARFQAHDSCFILTSGPHRSVRCTQCHSTLVGVPLTGSCTTGTARCISCHAHDCAREDQRHAAAAVMGYSCTDRKCFECHQRTPP